MLRRFYPFFACLCAQATLLTAASPVYAQVTSPESDIEWRNSPKPQIKQTERIHTPATPPTPNGPTQEVSPIWSVETTDVTLSNTLLRWSREEKWQLLWEADRDFPILATVYLKGSFQSAILTVMQSLSDTDYPMQAIMNPDTRIIRIVRYLQTPIGLKNILAMRGGYNSSLASNNIRQDGINAMTGTLNMGNNSISNVKDISATGDIKGFNFLAQNQIRANDRIFAGAAGDPNCAVSQAEHFGSAGDINACRDMVAKGYVKGLSAVQAGADNNVGVRLNKDGSIEGKTINVDTNKNITNINNITQSGGIKSQGVIETTQDFITAAGKKVQAGYFKFLNTVAEGAGCASDFANSLTLDTTNNNKLLRCDGTTWVSMLQKGDTGVQGIQGTQGEKGTGGRWVARVSIGNADDGYREKWTGYTCDYYVAVLEGFVSDDLWSWRDGEASAFCKNNFLYVYVSHPNTGFTGYWNIFSKY